MIRAGGRRPRFRRARRRTALLACWSWPP